MQELTDSLKIETLLRELDSSYYCMRDFIEHNPYQIICEILRLHCPNAVEAFEYNHKSMQNYSLSELRSNGYDIKLIIKDLENIIRKRG